MSLHNFNSANKSFIMYAHTLSSISGDDLTLKPTAGKNLILEVSGNNSVLIKKGTNVFDLTNLSGGTTSIVSGSDASFTNLDISANLNPYVVNSASIGLATKNWNSAYINNMYCETLRTYRSDNILSINSNTLMISGDLFTVGSLNPLNNNGSSLGSTSKIWGNAYIRDLSVGSIEVSGNIIPSLRQDISSNLGSSLKRWSTLFANDLSINKINGQVYNATTFSVLTTVSSNIIPISNNILKLGDVSNNWGNAYISDLSVSTIDVSVNLNPLLANRSSLGLPTRPWANAYIHDLSISSIDVSASLTPLISNRSSLGLSTRPWNNAYIRDLSVGSIDISASLTPLLASGSSLGLIGRNWNNAYIRDMSVSSIDISSNINPLLANSSSLGLPTRAWANAYIRDMSVGSIDVSSNLTPLNANSSSLGLITRAWNNAYIRDLSISSIDVSSNLNPLITERSSLGLPSKIWGNAYIRDLSISNLDVSGNITPLIPNNSNLGSSLNRWNRLFSGDLSINTINGQAYTSGGGTINLASITSNIIPSTTNTFNLGSRTNYWNNGYIRNLVTSARAYQGISGDISGGNFGDISWSAVNGYYGLAKDAYPALNPRSSGALAVRTWYEKPSILVGSGRLDGVCWSPELRLFVAVGGNAIAYSPNGITWTTGITISEVSTLLSVCWSPQLRLFAAVSRFGTFRIITSPDAITWTPRSLPETREMVTICWSPELGIFVAISLINRGMISQDGITWTTISPPHSGLGTICWSAELRLFVIVNSNGRIVTSSDGTTWTQIIPSEANDWRGVCWSPELGIFVAVARTGINRVMTSRNGINWTVSKAVLDSTWVSVCWCPQIRLFIALAEHPLNSFMGSPDGINWSIQTQATPSNTSGGWKQICWSPELGIAIAISDTGSRSRLTVSSLKGRPPTSYNVFDSSFNSINETGRWEFSNITVTTMRAGGTNVTSDNRLKHNEIAITNGLTIIDKLVPKFYQKTFDMLDASYNGDLSGHSCTYEAGLIAQEVLQISDLSYVVSGGDYYEKIINYYDTISNYYDTSANYYDTSSNYEISYNLVTQSYSLNYNSIFVYGLAAIKELHAKVKIIETNSLDEQLNSLVTRLEALEQNIS
jgi:hypothetical protein